MNASDQADEHKAIREPSLGERQQAYFDTLRGATSTPPVETDIRQQLISEVLQCHPDETSTLIATIDVNKVLALISQTVSNVIGDGEELKYLANGNLTYDSDVPMIRNGLRDEQRTTAKRLLGRDY